MLIIYKLYELWLVFLGKLPSSSRTRLHKAICNRMIYHYGSNVAHMFSLCTAKCGGVNCLKLGICRPSLASSLYLSFLSLHSRREHRVRALFQVAWTANNPHIILHAWCQIVIKLEVKCSLTPMPACYRLVGYVDGWTHLRACQDLSIEQVEVTAYGCGQSGDRDAPTSISCEDHLGGLIVIQFFAYLKPLGLGNCHVLYGVGIQI